MFWECVFSLVDTACHVHAPYCHLWPAWLYSIFQHCLINCMIFETQLLNILCVFWLSLQLLSGTFLTVRINCVSMIKNVYWSSCIKCQLLLWALNETWIFVTEFWKLLKYKISWPSVQWDLSCSMKTDGWTDMWQSW